MAGVSGPMVEVRVLGRWGWSHFPMRRFAMVRVRQRARTMGRYPIQGAKRAPVEVMLRAQAGSGVW